MNCNVYCFTLRCISHTYRRVYEAEFPTKLKKKDRKKGQAILKTSFVIPALLKHNEVVVPIKPKQT